MGPPSSAVAIITTRAALRSSRAVDVSCHIGRFWPTFRWGDTRRVASACRMAWKHGRGAVDVTRRYRTQLLLQQQRLLVFVVAGAAECGRDCFTTRRIASHQHAVIGVRRFHGGVLFACNRTRPAPAGLIGFPEFPTGPLRRRVNCAPIVAHRFSPVGRCRRCRERGRTVRTLAAVNVFRAALKAMPAAYHRSPAVAPTAPAAPPCTGCSAPDRPPPSPRRRIRHRRLVPQQVLLQVAEATAAHRAGRRRTLHQARQRVVPARVQDHQPQRRAPEVDTSRSSSPVSKRTSTSSSRRASTGTSSRPEPSGAHEAYRGRYGTRP